MLSMHFIGEQDFDTFMWLDFVLDQSRYMKHGEGRAPNMVYILSARPVYCHSEADHAASLAGKRMKQSKYNRKSIGVAGNQV